MPIYQTDLDLTRRKEFQLQRTPPPPPPSAPSHSRRFSEESLPVELCEGPLPDTPEKPAPIESVQHDVPTSDRSTLIERLKRGQSPTWLPSHHIESFIHHDDAAQTGKTSRSSSSSSNLLPAPQITPEKQDRHETIENRLQDGREIERPRSALHSGDFTHTEVEASRRRKDHLATESAWLATSPPRHFTPSFKFEKQIPFSESNQSIKSALSSSISSSFAYQPPTSPLAQSVTNDDLDPAPLASERFGSYRRHVFSFEHSSPYSTPSRTPGSVGSRSLRRESSFPYQAHQPRRSLTSTPSFLQHGSSPQTPSLLRPRRPSLGSEMSPIQHASMVGSYEESILRGRMSTTPSKPFDFTAQIGVLGKGKCKPSLRCPAHVSLPFSAVYYNYNASSQSAGDGPSPYVGQVDLENGLPNLEDGARQKRKYQNRYGDKMQEERDIDMCLDGPIFHDHTPARSRSKRSSTTPRAPPGGSYRIPEKGQLQIIIKNQNKTAVKLFLVPYDLTGMTPGTKTFIRQRSYSNGPIIDNVPSVAADDPLNRPILRYLVHLHICCPARGRFYLYKNVRIVFANRVPEGKEKLRNETTWPEPRFSTYKPIRVMNMPQMQTSGRAASLAAETAYRRRSSLGVPTAENSQRPSFETLMYSSRPQHHDLDPPSGYRGGGSLLPLDPIPFHLPSRRRDTGNSDMEAHAGVANLVRSPGSTQSSRPSTEDSAVHPSESDKLYEKLNRGDAGYGGNAFGIVDSSSRLMPSPEGLLSQRLRTLGVQHGKDVEE